MTALGISATGHEGQEPVAGVIFIGVGLYRGCREPASAPVRPPGDARPVRLRLA